MFNCRFQDGTLVTNLTYAESLKMFDEAFHSQTIPAPYSSKINHIKHPDDQALTVRLRQVCQ